MTLRIALAGLSHETNTYADPMGLTDADAFIVKRGAEIADFVGGAGTYLGGMLDAVAELGAEPVLLTYAIAWPSGTIVASAYEALRDEIVEGVRAALPVDAVALELHGAGVAEGYFDIEGDLGARLREIVGPDVPIVAALDLHGNVTDTMGEVFDVLYGVHLYPHTDMYERGVEAIRAIPELLAGRWRPTTYIEHLPITLPTSTTDAGFPAARMNAVCAAVEGRPGVIDATVFHGFPFTDTPHVGVHVIVTTNDDVELATSCAGEIASWIWAHRTDFHPTTFAPAEAIRHALSLGVSPVVINDTADNPGGGAPGDSTHVLRALLDAGLDLVAERACFGFINDGSTAAAAHAAGVGATIDIELGGHHDDLHGNPILASAYVKCLTDGKLVHRSFASGVEFDFGLMARLVIDGVEVVVGSRPWQTVDPSVFELHGIDVRDFRLVVLKSSNHFRAGFRDIAAAIVTADSPGLTTQRVEIFERSRHDGPLWPRNAETQWPSS